MTPKRRQRENRLVLYQDKTYQMIKERIAFSVRQLRNFHGWSQKTAAEKCSLSLRLFQRIEHAEGNLTLVTIARLCKGFSADILQLFYRASS